MADLDAELAAAAGLQQANVRTTSVVAGAMFDHSLTIGWSDGGFTIVWLKIGSLIHLLVRSAWHACMSLNYCFVMSAFLGGLQAHVVRSCCCINLR